MTDGRSGRYDPDGRSFQSGLRRRPRWMAFFTFLMFLVGARVFLGSVDDLYRLATGKPEVVYLDGSRDPQQEALLRAQVVFDNELRRARPRVMLAQALAHLLVGLVYLLAVAAVVAKDARGRRVCLIAGWLGLAASAGNAAFIVLWASKALEWVVPRLAEALAADAARLGRPVPTIDMVAEQAQLFLIDGPVALCGMGMVLSLVLLAYFAGRRMRWFYEQLGEAHGR
jgi:hypothetical protein